MMDYMFHSQDAFFPKERVLDWAIQMTETVEYLHTQHFYIHRDLHMKNWVIDDTQDDFLVLVDLNNGLFLDGPDDFIPEGPNNYVISQGIKNWCAPEQCAHQQYSFNADVWQLGLNISWMASKDVISFDPLNRIDCISQGMPAYTGLYDEFAPISSADDYFDIY